MSTPGRKDDLYAIDLSAAKWRKSRYSNAGNQCVEITDLPGGGIAIRDSKNPAFPALRYTAEEWDAFRKGVRSGEL
ncbi:DUF397 domain-containing protein [Streptomyces sp. NBS 14/10]|uniref:DUF397 domain-containing protein n=1 Tax=Streptomyces sp. NBS 14/10 TaxID=1945643 RepID=UPI000B7DFFAB|nr:DUF397 domain-containing protein [Streptomyces sp. NBS 14/10]KAK1180482.1 DUF397 domain-containing protein [Streptomyces sp. NBS 14/10]